VATAAALGIACGEPPAAVAPPPPEVYVAPVIQKDVPEYLELVGQTQGFQDVEIRARVEGYLETVNFREGSFVRRGDLLYQIDRKPLEATLAAARADVAEARAKLEKANNDVERYTPLVSKKAVSQQELDNALAARDAARSQVDAATANVDKATLDLGYTRVVSPIDGLIGTTLIKAGNLVGRGEATLLATVSQLNPMILRVAVTEADYLRVIRRDPARAGEEPQQEGIELRLANGAVYPEKGKIGPVERAVDASTGTLGIQVLFENHFGPTIVPDNCVKLCESVEGLGMLLDTHNFKPTLRDEGRQKCAKYAAATHVKTFNWDAAGNEVTPDEKVEEAIKILLDAGYQGVWGVESVPADAEEHAGARRTVDLIRRLVG